MIFTQYGVRVIPVTFVSSPIPLKIEPNHHRHMFRQKDSFQCSYDIFDLAVLMETSSLSQVAFPK